MNPNNDWRKTWEIIKGEIKGKNLRRILIGGYVE